MCLDKTKEIEDSQSPMCDRFHRRVTKNTRRMGGDNNTRSTEPGEDAIALHRCAWECDLCQKVESTQGKFAVSGCKKRRGSGDFHVAVTRRSKTHIVAPCRQALHIAFAGTKYTHTKRMKRGCTSVRPPCAKLTSATYNTPSPPNGPLCSLSPLCLFLSLPPPSLFLAPSLFSNRAKGLCHSLKESSATA